MQCMFHFAASQATQPNSRGVQIWRWYSMELHLCSHRTALRRLPTHVHIQLHSILAQMPPPLAVCADSMLAACPLRGQCHCHYGLHTCQLPVQASSELQDRTKTELHWPAMLLANMFRRAPAPCCTAGGATSDPTSGTSAGDMGAARSCTARCCQYNNVHLQSLLHMPVTAVANMMPG